MRASIRPATASSASPFQPSSPRGRAVCTALLLTVLLTAPGVSAHEFWIMPSSFEPPPLTQVGFSLLVGTGWPGESVPRSAERIVRFDLVDARGEHPIAGDEAADPAGFASTGALGPALAVYRSNRAQLTLPAEKFEAYLVEEGLDSVVRRRAARGESGKPGREVYSRCAKSLLMVGGRKARAGSADRVLGLTLELIPETDPQRMLSDRSLTVRLLYDGQPLAGALIRARPEKQPSDKFEIRSDVAGRATIPLRHGGVWLISAVHMIEAPPALAADWESFWASLTFSLPE